MAENTPSKHTPEGIEPGCSSPDEFTSDDVPKLIEQLRKDEIELEIRNEELRRARGEIEESRLRYTELYDSAPVSYYTLDARGSIVACNLKQIGGAAAGSAVLPTQNSNLDPEGGLGILP